MPLTKTNQHAPVAFEYGVSNADAPTIPGFRVTSVELKSEPEVFAQAQEGEGHTDAVVVSKPENFMQMATVTGNISDLAAYQALGGGTFTWRSRKFIIKGISEPRKKGEFVEGQVEAQSFGLIPP